jgi:hypothetical protein
LATITGCREYYPVIEFLNKSSSSNIGKSFTMGPKIQASLQTSDKNDLNN